MPLSSRRILVTGGAGFIGSAFIRIGLERSLCHQIVNLDILTYASDKERLAHCAEDPRYQFVHGDIRDEALVEELIVKYQIDTLVHFAAETHVDRSIAEPLSFFETNVGGTLSLLEVLRRHRGVHMHQISTDEVFGSLGAEGMFNETSAYAPSSPYSASKAAADHFVCAYERTYGLSLSISYCSNNYGPGQHREKLIPMALHCALAHRSICLYGNGENVRDWIFVDDHVEALWQIVAMRKKGERYAISAREEWSNRELLALLLGEIARSTGESREALLALIELVPDRPGHDRRYALDPTKSERELGWKPAHSLRQGLAKTVGALVAEQGAGKRGSVSC